MTPVTAVHWLFQFLYVLLIARVILSWISGVNYHHPAVHFVYRVTSPILNPIRRVVPSVAGLDLSPLIAILLLSIIYRAVINLMLHAAAF